MQEISEEVFTQERALFKQNKAKIKKCVFKIGESALKHASKIELDTSFFQYKYPLWYCDDVKACNIDFALEARSGIWYSSNINISKSNLSSPKNFRHSKNISLEDVYMPNASESFSSCANVNLSNLYASGDYFITHSKNIKAYNLNINGNYAFDTCKNITVRASKIISKDAFWNCENVEVYDSIIIGEYLAWNSKNISFINCKIQSLQALCYIKNLKLINCDLLDSTLAFEYSTVDIDLSSKIQSIFNPKSGIIRARSIDTIHIDEKEVNSKDIQIITRD